MSPNDRVFFLVLFFKIRVSGLFDLNMLLLDFMKVMTVVVEYLAVFL